MQPWPADLLGPGSDETKPDLRRVTRHQRAAGLRADLPAEQRGPEGRHRERVGHLEPHRFQPNSHLLTVGRARALATHLWRLAAYEDYRQQFGRDPDFKAADRIGDESGCVLRYRRSFLRPLLEGDANA